MRRFVIPDVHGCLKTLKTLIEKIGLTKEDQLYFLGDYIDKGKDSAGVLDFVMGLIEQSYSVFPLRGNHEENLLQAHKNYNAKMLERFVVGINRSGNLLGADGTVKTKYVQFIGSLAYFYELDDFWIVHAGFNTALRDFQEDKETMIRTRRFEYSEELLKGKKVIHGHKVTYLEAILDAVQNDKKVIPLDNGCVYNYLNKKYDYFQTGKLLCLELGSMELVQVKNMD